MISPNNIKRHLHSFINKLTIPKYWKCKIRICKYFVKIKEDIVKNSIIKRSLSYLLIFCLILIQMVPAATKVQAEETPEDFNGYPPLLITEISPNSAGTWLLWVFWGLQQLKSTSSIKQLFFYIIFTQMAVVADKAFPIPEEHSDTTTANTGFLVQPFWKNNRPILIKSSARTSRRSKIIFMKLQRVFLGFYNGGNRGRGGRR